MSSPAVPTIVSYIFPAGVTDPPTVAQVFGLTPWNTSVEVTGPTGPNGALQTTPLVGGDEYAFATLATAQIVAAMVSGTVVESPLFPTGNRWSVNALQEIVLLPGGGTINPGVIATLFGNGYPLSMVASIVQNACVQAGYNVALAWTVAAPVAPPVTISLIGAKQVGGNYSPSSAAVLGIKGSPGVNMYQGMNYTGVDELGSTVTVVATVYKFWMNGTYSGWWTPVATA